MGLSSPNILIRNSLLSTCFIVFTSKSRDQINKCKLYNSNLNNNCLNPLFSLFNSLCFVISGNNLSFDPLFKVVLYMGRSKKTIYWGHFLGKSWRVKMFYFLFIFFQLENSCYQTWESLQHSDKWMDGYVSPISVIIENLRQSKDKCPSMFQSNS